MATINPIQLLMSLKGGDPQQMAISIIQQNYANDPEMQQLLQMGLNNDIDGVNKFAEKYFSQRGLNFSQELGSLTNTLKNM